MFFAAPERIIAHAGGPRNRIVTTAAGVVAFHVSILWALQVGLKHDAAELDVPARLELPSSNADYLLNPKPPYPTLSKRLNEQGKIVVRALIGVDGTAQKAEIKQSSGFDRLDQAALTTALRWRYVPGKRAGIPQAMWFTVPINFVLE